VTLKPLDIPQLQKYNYYSPLILDFTSAKYIAPDAAGLLIYLRSNSGEPAMSYASLAALCIAGDKPALRSVLQATFPAGEPFRVASTLQDALRLVWSPATHKAELVRLSLEAA
jgi:hypothetical protein